MKLNFYEEVARRKLGVGSDWRWCTLKAVGPDGTLVEGGIPRMLTRGPRKGQQTWRDAEISSCVVTDAEVNAARAEYEATTGNCWECCGSGQVVHSVSAAGTTYCACSKCNGSGKAAG